MLSWTVSFGLCRDIWDNLQLDTADSAGRADRNQRVPSTEAECANWAKHVPRDRQGFAGTDIWDMGQQPSGGVKSLAHFPCNARRWPVKAIYSEISELYAAGLWVFFFFFFSVIPALLPAAPWEFILWHKTDTEQASKHFYNICCWNHRTYSSD